MKINIETKYDIGDKLFIISDDCYSNIWFVNSDDKRRIIPFEVKQIVVRQYIDRVEARYLIKNFLYLQEHLFENLEDAIAECKKRNNEN